MKDTMPRARTSGLVTRSLRNELLVYDLDRHEASCLNRTAELVWRCCDGETRVAAVVTRLREELEVEEVDEQAVWLALDRLDGSHLLDETTPWWRDGGPSRREWLQGLARLGVQAALLPAVVTIVAPTVADAQTAVTSQECKALPLSQCGAHPCIGGGTCQVKTWGMMTGCWCL